MSTGVEILNGILENVEVGGQTLIDVSKKMLGDKEGLVFAIEKRRVCDELPKLADKMESPKRCHVFHDADGFAAYLGKYKTDDTVVLVDVVGQEASAILNEKADKGFEIVMLKPVIHPLFAPWADMLQLHKEGPYNLKAFVQFLSENRRAIVEPDRKGVIMTLSQVKVSKKITLHKGVAGNQRINGIICEMDIAGQSSTQEVQIPETITIEAPLYLSMPLAQIQIDISIDADDREVYVTCSSADVLQKTVEAFEVMMEQVRAIEGVVVTLGSPNHAAWARVTRQV